MRRPVIVQVAFGITLLSLTACISDRPTTGPSSDVQDVRIVAFEYVPPDVTVRSGTMVTWTNEDGVLHTVSSDDDTTFDSGNFGEGMTFQFTAGQPGTYSYFCRIHPFMRAKLTVTP